MSGDWKNKDERPAFGFEFGPCPIIKSNNLRTAVSQNAAAFVRSPNSPQQDARFENHVGCMNEGMVG